MGVRFIFLVSTLFICFPLHAQKGKGDIFFTPTHQNTKCPNSIKSTDSLSVAKYYSECIKSFHQQGFLEARIDSISIGFDRIVGFGFKGNRYKYVFANPDSTSIYWMRMSGLKKQRSGAPVNVNDFVKTSEQLLSYMEKKGYPFARVSYQNSKYLGDTITVDIRVDPGPLIRLDTLYIMGNTKVSHQFIMSHLNFVKGNPYKSNSIERYDQRIKDLGFLKVIRPTEVEFVPGKVRIYSYLEDKPASQFSGLVGFASPNDGSSGIRFTGDINLRLTNIFKQGERNIVQWQSLGEGTQRLNLSSSWNYLFGSSVGFNAQFKLYRRDTTYLNINPKIDMDFVFANGNIVGLGFDFRKSSAVVASSNQNVANVSTSLYKLSYRTGLMAEDIFPTKYFWATATLGIGNRNGLKRPDDLSKSTSNVGELSSRILVYFPLYKPNVVLHLRFQGEMLESVSSSSQTVSFFENELYRIGGINSLRGFNQESIVTDKYGIGTVELQFRLKSLLNAYIFYDHSIVSNSQVSAYQFSWPYGVGVGFQMVSLGGILNFSYGLGKGMGEELLLRSAKLHIGYIANF